MAAVAKRIARAAAIVVAFLAGCTFPEVRLEDGADDVGSVGGDASSGEASTDARGDATPTDGSDGHAPETTSADGVPPGDDGVDTADTHVIDDTNPPPPDDAHEDSGTCDRDHDGYEPIAAGCAPASGAADCDDETFAANPGVLDLVIVPPPPTLPLGGDWNCNGVLEKQFTQIASCPGLSLGCTTRSGITADVPCGATTTYVSCVVSTLVGCVEGAKTTVTMGCK
jgi:hypothetical protein